MPKARPAWLEFVLELPPQEISRGAYIDIPQHDKKTNTYHTAPHKIRGTRFTTGKIEQFIYLGRIPAKKDMHKLRLFYERYTYNSLRASGSSPSQTRKLFRQSPEGIAASLRRYDTAIKALAEARGAPILSVQYTMGKSDVRSEDLRRRMITSGLKDWKGAMSPRELDAIVNDLMKAGLLAELDEDEDE